MKLPLTFKVSVVPGRGVGKKLGFPTLNFILPAGSGLEFGVYAGYVNEYAAVFNYGPRPTFDLAEAILEAHLLGFSGTWEEVEVQVTLGTFLREIRKFDSADDLKKQIREDIRQAKKLFP
ncbi:MAG: riboflavin kinase [Candidatus Gracilibacteria bacterium]|nr:riboflavin kinase [Candidatus Gracilibacteria bacterium]